MKVIILCAGYATRLYPLTKDKPKPLLPVAGRPILEWILNRLKEVPSIEKVYAVTNHRFSSHFQSWSEKIRYPWPVEISDDQTTTNENRLGAIGDLIYVLKEKKIGEEDLFVIAGDNFFDFDLRAFVQSAEARRPHPVIAVFDVQDRELAKQYGLVKLGEGSRILEFYEKPADPPTTLASCGLYFLPKESRVLLDRYVRSGHNLDQPGHYMRWLAEMDSLYAASLKGQWLDIGDCASYEKANAILLDSAPNSGAPLEE